MVAILTSLVMVSAIAEAQSISKVLLIPREAEGYSGLDTMLIKEVGVMTDLLQRAGFKVVVGTTPGQPFKPGKRLMKPQRPYGKIGLRKVK